MDHHSGRGTSTSSPSGAARRRGFTLIELLVVISIIAVLVSLLLGAISSVRSTMRVTQTRAELSLLETALENFKAEFGTYPPSRVTLCEVPADWTSTAETKRSKAIFLKLFSNMDFTLARDFNGDTDTTDAPITLNGAECLVAFLGGVADTSGTVINMKGFSKNPSDPFDLTTPNRIGPFHEFATSRLRTGTTGVVFLDHFPGQTTPIWYLSSYEGRGYEFPGEPTDATPGDMWPLPAAVPPANDIPLVAKPYLTSETGTISGANLFLQGNEANYRSEQWKTNTYQLISPGPDGEYGFGGQFAEAVTPKSYFLLHDADNVTNFVSGRMR